MGTLELLLVFVRPLNALGIRYIIGGSVATIFYGEPRFTYDVDFIVFLNHHDAQRLAETFTAPNFYFPPLETVLQETSREKLGHFNIIHNPTGFKADIYLSGRDELNAWGFRMKQPIQFEGETIVLAPPEYVILKKLEYYREGGSQKHLRDIQSILDVSKKKLDHAVLKEWIHRLGLEKEWHLLQT